MGSGFKPKNQATTAAENDLLKYPIMAGNWIQGLGGGQAGMQWDTFILALSYHD